MNNYILYRLEALSENCPDANEKATIDAERAYHMARVGYFTEAHALLRSIRANPTVSSTPVVVIWLILSEGIVDFFENLSQASHDRFRRAYALSVATKQNSLRALAAAWLAHTEFMRQDYEAMIDAANDCLSFYPDENKSAQSRIFIVLASAHMSCGNFGASRRFFEMARNIAVVDGDRATLGAIAYNQAALMLNGYRLRNIFDSGEQIDLALVSITVESATNFQEITKNTALGELISICSARSLINKKQYSNALKILEDLRASDSTYSAGIKSETLAVEYAYCLANLGDLTRTLQALAGLDIKLCTNLHHDDKVILLSQLVEIYNILGLKSEILDLSDQIAEAQSAHLAQISKMRSAMQRLKFAGDLCD